MTRLERALLFMLPFVAISGLARYVPFGASPAAAIEAQELPVAAEEVDPPLAPPIDLVAELESIVSASRVEVAQMTAREPGATSSVSEIE